jgi:phosphate transport system permease protein
MQQSSPPPAAQRPASFTGRSRQRQTRRAVVWQDRIASGIIQVGGLATVLSVLGVMVFLLWVVAPLFTGAEDSERRTLAGPAGVAQDPIVQIGIDEYQVLGWVLRTSGRLDILRMDDGSKIGERQLFPAATLTAADFPIASREAAFGFADGTLQLVAFDFETSNLAATSLPAEVVEGARAGRTMAWEDGVVQQAGEDQFRFQHMVVAAQPASTIASTPVRALAFGQSGDGPLIAALVDGPGGSEGALDSGAARRLLLLGFEEKTSFLTGETTLQAAAPVEVPFVARPTPPTRIELSGAGTDLYLAWDDGLLDRFSARDLSAVERLERGYLIDPAQDGQLTTFTPILGGNTYLWGDAAGRLRGGFLVRPSEAEDPSAALGLMQAERGDGDQVFAKTKELVASGPAVGPIASSARTRLALAGFADGTISLFNVTNETAQWSTQVEGGQAIQALVMAPKEDGVLAATAGGLFHAKLRLGYSEAGFRAFFRPVWYEGYPQPEHVWQSSSGTDDFEMKLGLMPLIFGTLKATFYSMLFGAPLALLGAIFTSEFLRGRPRAILKPSIEIMASLPSVVLGFLAALVIAPWVEGVVPAVLASVFVIPILFVLGAQLWQLLPADIAIRYQGTRFLWICALVPIGAWISSWVGPLYERIFFAGDFKAWLAWAPDSPDGDRFTGAVGGWMFLAVPLCALAVAVLSERWLSPLLRDRSHIWDRRRFALIDLLRIAACIVATFAMAWLLASLASALGFDPRGSYFDTYVQRNAMIVGFVMGFAIIPIIFTISEDALSTVPEHLRSASLGAGATPWQTAVRIVIPTAMSGLFSALMIGLGRAVGETMIVLMAAGNTPVMSWNLFEGFRTLSANIAVELPEAVRGGIHYRTLFLAALVLFVITFVVNTVAEIIRQRFRKRAYQL